MFGMKRKAQELADVQAGIVLDVRDEILAELAEVSAASIRDAASEEDRERMRQNVEDIRLGVDLVLVRGFSAYGPELAGHNDSVRKGASIAHSSRNLAIIARTGPALEARRRKAA